MGSSQINTMLQQSNHKEDKELPNNEVQNAAAASDPPIRSGAKSHYADQMNRDRKDLQEFSGTLYSVATESILRVALSAPTEKGDKKSNSD